MDEDSPRPDAPGHVGATSTNLQHVLIKWRGSKRRQARQIVAKFPRQIATYYEAVQEFVFFCRKSLLAKKLL